MDISDAIRGRQNANLEVNPRWLDTMDGTKAPTPHLQNNPNISGYQGSKIKYTIIDEMGTGQYGVVNRVVDLDTGRVMAVKAISRSDEDEEWTRVKREVSIISNFKHPHIVEFIAEQGWDENKPEIFMSLKDGSLSTLLNIIPPASVDNIASAVFGQMLQALDYLAVEHIIHRDVKPDNILYTGQNGQFHFCLSDFGVSNSESLAVSCSGSPPFMAPEVIQFGE
ncbi:putative serine/threonine-protein kinase tsuA [Cladobotryum mycophilum]|uniref:mitogen-activated protein kinase kinase n=1 Tax=Cladobotryum mycophilum TaxID=491253 RepID=A0ABR0SWH4_9HYPO